MKRDLELIRKILETIESRPFQPGKNLDIDGSDFQTIAFHMDLLVEAGYLKATIITNSTLQYTGAWPIRLTWEGYEFLDLARNDSTWQKTKKFLSEKSTSVSVAILTELLKSFVKDSLGIGH